MATNTKRQQVLGTVITTAVVASFLTLGSNLPFCVRGHAYSGNVWGIGGAAPGYSYLKTSGPAWVVVDPATGAVSGNCPAGQSSFDLGIQVTDALFKTFPGMFHIVTGYTIDPPGGWTPSNSKTVPAVQGQPYQFDVSKLLTGLTLPATFTISAGAAPAGIAFPSS